MTEVVWGGFLAFFLTLLFLDLSVLHRESAELSVRQALFWTLVWVSVAFSFTFVIYGLYEHHWLGWMPGHGVANGTDAVVQFVTGYLLEWSLSVDNIFVIALIFAYLCACCATTRGSATSARASLRAWCAASCR